MSMTRQGKTRRSGSNPFDAVPATEGEEKRKGERPFVRTEQEQGAPSPYKNDVKRKRTGRDGHQFRSEQFIPSHPIPSRHLSSYMKRTGWPYFEMGYGSWSSRQKCVSERSWELRYQEMNEYEVHVRYHMSSINLSIYLLAKYGKKEQSPIRWENATTTSIPYLASLSTMFVT